MVDAQTTKRALAMNDTYNESVGDWSMESVNMTINEFKSMVAKINLENPERFKNIDVPFAIAEFGCATGASSTAPLITLIEEIRLLSPDMPISIYLNDMPDNHHQLAIKTVSNGLKKYKEVYLYVSGQDFSTQVFATNTIDIAFSNLTAMILAEAPVPLENNMFFLATPETLETTWGQEWVKAFNTHWENFVDKR